MYREKRQFGQDPAKVVRSSDKTFYAPLKWREPRYIFACSWGDFFHPAGDEWRPEAWDVIRRCPQHTWLILTKRPELIVARLPEGWPWPHVALGVTAENQARLDERGPIILSIPAALHFLSWEPGLGPIHITPPFFQYDKTFRNFGWVITGGESGPDARPTHPDWVRSLRDQAKAAGIPFCFKQWGEWAVIEKGLSKKGDITLANYGPYPNIFWHHERPVRISTHVSADCVVMRRVGKKNAGRYLDGEIWDERPSPLGNK